ncbi:MAG: glutamate racemase [Flavobacteriales bacterium]|nr:MAG: glutamate racemase [Flavobacteriales bacterium]
MINTLNNNIKNINQLSIGIFDSGLGGLSICKEITKQLPNESIIYLADSNNTPYGEKSKGEIINLSIKNTELLLELGCKLIVVACNTATTNAIDTLRKKYDIPFVGIEPATKPAALQTKSGKIGILATKGTLNSDLFLTTSHEFRDKLEIIETEGKNLVRLIEKGLLDETKPLLEKYLTPMIEQGVDNIVLGCTHYSFLIPIIKQIVPNHITIIDSGEAVAKQTQKVLEKEGLLNLDNKNVARTFYTNGDLNVLSEFLQRIEISADDEIVFRVF